MKITQANLDKFPLQKQLLLSELLKCQVQLDQIENTNIIFAKKGQRTRILIGSYTSLVPHNIGLILSNKHFIREILKNAKIPIAQGQIFRPSEFLEAQMYAKSFDFCVILRQENTQRDIPTLCTINRQEEFAIGWNHLKKFGENILVEKKHTGTNMKVFYSTSGYWGVFSLVEKSVESFFTENSRQPLQSSQKIWQSQHNLLQVDLKKMAQKVLKAFPSLPYVYFDIIQNDEGIIVTEVYHSAQSVYDQNIFRGKKSKRVVEVVTEHMFNNN